MNAANNRVLANTQEEVMKLNECEHVCKSIADSIKKAKEYGLNQITVYVILLEDVLDLLNEHTEFKRILASEETIEVLADIEHERWSGWMRYQFANWTDENTERWKMQMVTPYADLPGHSKESDRKEVRKTLAAIDALLAKDGER